MPSIETKALIDTVMRYALLAERTKNGVVNRALRSLKALRQALEREIALDAVNFTVNLSARLEGLLERLGATIDVEVNSLWLALSDDIRTWMELNGTFQANLLARQGIEPPAIDESGVNAWWLLLLATPILGRLPAEELTALKRVMFEQVRRVLRESSFEQRPLQPTLIDFRQAWRRREHEFDAFIKTLLAGAGTVVERDIAEKSKVGFWQSIGVLDNRISRICLYHHGRVYPVSPTAPWPPRHARCRTRVLLLPNRRSALNLPDPDKWLGGRSQVERERLLGAIRAALWARGVPLRRLLATNGDDLSLETLRRRLGGLFQGIETTLPSTTR